MLSNYDLWRATAPGDSMRYSPHGELLDPPSPCTVYRVGWFTVGREKPDDWEEFNTPEEAEAKRDEWQAEYEQMLAADLTEPAVIEIEEIVR